MEGTNIFYMYSLEECRARGNEIKLVTAALNEAKVNYSPAFTKEYPYGERLEITLGGMKMTDTFSKDKRHEVMSKIRSKDTKIEIKVRHWLYHHGIRYRKNCKDIAGKPDIAIKKYKIAIFINGCFWHGHENCKLFRLPKANLDYWKEKIAMNINRDQKSIEKLTHDNWNVFILWECQLENDFEKTMEDILYEIHSIMRFKKSANDNRAYEEL